uniref:CSON004228 protein n=1 Tax=Culicoides sonorensis TaxID=179676 RepID=A0A336MP72_CULSO
MKILRQFLIIFTVSNLSMSVNSANIMGIYTTDMKSHYLIAQNLLKELAKSGHNVTVFTGFKTPNLPANYREVTLKLPSMDAFKKDMAKDGSPLNLFKKSFNVIEFMKLIPRSVILSDEMQTLINTKQEFDAILMGFSENSALFGLSQTFNAPIIVTSSQKLSFMVEYFTGAFAHDSFVVNPLLGFRDKMNFIERLIPCGGFLFNL